MSFLEGDFLFKSSGLLPPKKSRFIFAPMPQQILILDFGSQYTQLIARRVRELNVYCEIHPFNKIPPLHSDIKGVILSGSPCSVRDQGSPDIDLTLFDGKMPILG